MNAKSIRVSLDVVAHATGVGALARLLGRGQLTILMYHRVLRGQQARDYATGLSVDTDGFARHVSLLTRTCRFTTITEGWRLVSEGSLEPVVAITFDDGYADNAEVAAPILEDHGVRGTFFVCTDFIGRGVMLWFDRAAELWRRDAGTCRDHAQAREPGHDWSSEDSWLPGLKTLTPLRRSDLLDAAEQAISPAYDADLYRPMSVEQARDLQARGHEIGCHTRSHPILTTLTDAELSQEVVENRHELSAMLDSEVRSFSYPNGRWSARELAAVRQAGFETAVTTKSMANRANGDPHLLGRRHIQTTRVTDGRGRHSDAAFRAEVWGLHSGLRRMLGRRG